MEQEYKTFQIRLPLPLYEDFFRAFPGRGQRKLLVERFILLAIENRDNQDCFIEGLLRRTDE